MVGYWKAHSIDVLFLNKVTNTDMRIIADTAATCMRNHLGGIEEPDKFVTAQLSLLPHLVLNICEAKDLIFLHLCGLNLRLQT